MQRQAFYSRDRRLVLRWDNTSIFVRNRNINFHYIKNVMSTVLEINQSQRMTLKHYFLYLVIFLSLAILSLIFVFFRESPMHVFMSTKDNRNQFYGH